MKSGARALGVAESFAGDRSTLAGVVVRADRTVDGVAFATCTVGGTDATDAVIRLWDRLDREDVRHVVIAGVAPAWYNLLSLERVHRATDRPVLAVTFEAGESLEEPLREQFSGAGLERRLETYRGLPPRERVGVGDGTVYVRSVGLPRGDAADVVRAHTHEGGRPEPLRVARLVARAADAWRRGPDAQFPGEDA